MKSKRFVLRKSLIGTNTNIEVTFKDGRTVEYAHDKAYEIMKSKLVIPVVLRDKELV